METNQQEALSRAGLTAIRLAREGDQQAAETLRAQQDRIAELESQLEAIGSGGVEPLRKRECLHSISEPEAQPVGVAPEWWRKRADEIETDVARGGSIAAMKTAIQRCASFFRLPPHPRCRQTPVVLPEPDAVLRFERSTAGKENEMPSVVSCNWLPDGEYKLYTEQQVRAMLMHRKLND